MKSRVIMLVLVAIAISVTASAQDRLKPGETFRDCPECPEMVVIPVIPAASTSLSRESHSPPTLIVPRQRQSTIPPVFALGKNVVTDDEWQACLRDGGCVYRPGEYDSQVAGLGGWYAARAYARWLSQKTGHEYRLPSEAEWEHAERSASVSWFQGSRGGWEWLEDCWYIHREGLRSDLSARTIGDCQHRVVRDGSWSTRHSWSTRPRFGETGPRIACGVEVRCLDVRFRVARTLP